MKALTCASARRRLAAFHDEELAVADQIAVSAHLDWCSECADEFAELRTLQAALRGASPGRAALAVHEDATFETTVLSRMNAEETLSFETQVREMFEDMHLVYAGLGAAVAAMVCVVIMLGMMRVATAEEPDSLAAMMRMLASPPPRVNSPGTNQNPVGLYPDVQMPRPLDALFFATSSGAGTDDTVFTLTAVVTREGRVANLEMLRASRVGRRAIRDATDANDAQRAEDLMGAVSFARFQPANFAGTPVAVNMVWIVAHTTVRGSSPAGALDLPVRRTIPARKPVATLVPASPPSVV